MYDCRTDQYFGNIFLVWGAKTQQTQQSAVWEYLDNDRLLYKDWLAANNLPSTKGVWENLDTPGWLLYKEWLAINGASISPPPLPSGGGGSYARWPQQPRYNDDEEVLMLVATAFMHILDMEGES